jgi:hypothetical protein
MVKGRHKTGKGAAAGATVVGREDGTAATATGKNGKKGMKGKKGKGKKK